MRREIIPSTKNYFKRIDDYLDDYEPYNSEWLLSPKGDMKHCYVGYEIAYDILEKGDWLLHLSAKRWFDANTFIPAYFEACRRAGLRNIKMIVDY